MNYIKKMALPVLTSLLLFPTIGTAQKLVLEKTYQVDKKAKKGYLDNVIVNPDDNTTTLSFVTKAKSSKNTSTVFYQNYIFDKEYNFVKKEEKEDVYTNKKFKGENYSVEGITLEPGLLGGITIKKKRTEYAWSWLALNYTMQTKVLDKIKVKDEDGNKYFLIKQYANEETGEIYALVMGKSASGAYDEYSVIKVDQNLKFEIVEKFTFAKTKGFRTSFTLPQVQLTSSNDIDISNDDISYSDMCFIFAASYSADPTKLGEHTDFEMIRISNKGKVQNRAEFKVQGSEWNITSVTSSADGSLYLVGPANPGKPLKSGASVSVNWGNNEKWKFYQIAKITGDKAEYVTATNMEDFEAKLKKPASQKKSPEYKGKKFTVKNTTVTPDGSLFVYGQNFGNDSKWDDILMFYFDKNGILKAQYGVRLEERNSFSELNMAKQYLTVTDNYAYWEIWELENIDDGRVLRYPNIAKINLANSEIGDFQKFGTQEGKQEYYLQNSFPCIINPADKSLIYLGLNKKGNVFWFGKIVNE